MLRAVWLSVAFDFEAQTKACLRDGCGGRNNETTAAHLPLAFIDRAGRAGRGQVIIFNRGGGSRRARFECDEQFGAPGVDGEASLVHFFDALVRVQERSEARGPPRLQVVRDEETAFRKFQLSDKAREAESKVIRGGRVAAHDGGVRVEPRFRDANLIKPVIGEAVERIVAFAFVALAAPVNEDGVVMRRQGDAGVARIARQVMPARVSVKNLERIIGQTSR